MAHMRAAAQRQAGSFVSKKSSTFCSRLFYPYKRGGVAPLHLLSPPYPSTLAWTATKAAKPTRTAAFAITGFHGRAAKSKSAEQQVQQRVASMCDNARAKVNIRAATEADAVAVSELIATAYKEGDSWYKKQDFYCEWTSRETVGGHLAPR